MTLATACIGKEESWSGNVECEDRTMTYQTAASELVEQALDRIVAVDQLTNAICTLNPSASDDAAARDAEASEGRRRSALHGQLVLVKDNIDTADLLTTAGSLALSDTPPTHDAPSCSGCGLLGWSSSPRRT